MEAISFIVFDLDGTFYDLSDVELKNYEMQMEFYKSKTGKTKEEIEKIFTDNNIFPRRLFNSKSATIFFEESGFSMKEWNEYRTEHYPVQSINKKTSVSDSVIKKYAEIADVYLLSSNAQKTICDILKWLEIEEDNFKGIFCSDSGELEGTFSKKSYMNYIAESHNYSVGNAVSIGDRKKTDIDPMLELGGHGVLVKDSTGVVELLEKLQRKTWKESGANFRFY